MTRSGYLKPDELSRFASSIARPYVHGFGELRHALSSVGRRRPSCTQTCPARDLENRGIGRPLWRRGPAPSRLQSVDQDLGGRTGRCWVLTSDQEAILDRVDTPVLDLGINGADAK